MLKLIMALSLSGAIWLLVMACSTPAPAQRPRLSPRPPTTGTLSHVRADAAAHRDCSAANASGHADPAGQHTGTNQYAVADQHARTDANAAANQHADTG